MASITKHKGRWRAQVARKGVRKSRIFETKREAQDWAARQEYLILHGEKAAARVGAIDAMRLHHLRNKIHGPAFDLWRDESCAIRRNRLLLFWPSRTAFLLCGGHGF